VPRDPDAVLMPLAVARGWSVRRDDGGSENDPGYRVLMSGTSYDGTTGADVLVGRKFVVDHLRRWTEQPPQTMAQTDEEDAQKLARKYRIETRAREINAEREAEADERLKAATVPVLLADVQAQPVKYRVETLIPAKGLGLLWAESKAGKTTLVLNYDRALTVPGVPFMGYAVTPLADGARIGLLSYETNDEQIRHWSDQIGMDQGRVALWDLRGKPNPLASGWARGQLVEWMQKYQAEVLQVGHLLAGVVVRGRELQHRRHPVHADAPGHDGQSADHGRPGGASRGLAAGPAARCHGAPGLPGLSAGSDCR